MNSPRLLSTIENCSVTWDGTCIEFTARGRIDTDGRGSGHGDRWHQSDTTLHDRGRPLDADVDRFIVLPPQIIRAVAPIVLGCQVEVTYRGVTAAAVVGDVGPGHRLGEMSPALARVLGIDPDPNRGGEDRPIVHYRVYPGIAAVVVSTRYALQRSA